MKVQHILSSYHNVRDLLLFYFSLLFLQPEKSKPIFHERLVAIILIIISNAIIYYNDLIINDSILR